MANVPLRTYINEIESTIEQKQTEEAIAHCRHILQTYPKNIDTYRMLGKAYLESQRYSNAADIFQRVLSALPDDFVSHVGMSIIREDEKNLDAAIWHMERAFEGQPYNAAIQGELRRLFGLRDGMEPPKVHLTRGALARMYVKGNLHQQAIAELRSAIAEDPQRFDLQVSLAQMYLQSGQNAKAIDTCGTIINKLPYCLDANYILAQLLETTDRSEEVEAYKKRVQELNPYYAYIGPNAPTVDRVPAQAVLIEQLIWDGGPAVATSDQPEWAASVGVTLGDSRAVDEGLPDWMSDSSDEAPALPASLDGEAHAEEGEIPDFMKDAGWEPSTGAFDESQSIFDPDDEDAPLETAEAVAGDIPDWLQQMAPPEAADSTDEAVEAPDEAIPSEESDSLDWLQEAESESEDEDGGLPDWLAPAAAAGAAGAIALLSTDDETSEPEEAPVDGDVPDWLQELDGEGEAPGGVESKEAEIPDWLQETVGEDVELPELAPEAKESGVTDWLQEMTDEEETVSEPTIEGEAVEAEDGEIPDWLAPAAGAAVAASILSSDGEDVDADEAEETDLPDWLQETIEEDEAMPVAEIEAVETEKAEMSDDEEAVSEPTIEGETLEAEDSEIPDWLAPAAGAVAAASVLSSDEDEATSDIEIEPAEAEETEIPDWLQDSIEEDEVTPNAEVEPSEAEEAAPEPVAEGEPVEAEDEALPDWLAPAAGATVAASILSSDEKKIDADEVEETDFPDWLQETTEEDEAVPVAEIEAVETEETEMPDWLQEMADDEEIVAEPVAEGEPAEAEDGEIPDWLQESIEEDETTSDAEMESDEAEEVKIPDLLQETGGEEETSLEPIAEIEIEEAAPEPVAEIVPDEVDEAEPAEAEAGESPDWLQEAVDDEQLESDEDEDVEPVLSKGSEIPDWLQEAIEDEVSEPIAEAEALETEIPEWIQEVADEEPPESTDETEDGQLPDTLKAVGAIGAAAAGIAAIAADDAESQTEESVEMPIAEIPSDGMDLSGDTDDADAAMAWMESLATKQGVSEDELLTSPEERSETPPDWVQETVDDQPALTEPATVEPDEPIETPAAKEDEILEIVSTQEIDDQTEDGTSEIATDDLPDWLQEIPEKPSSPRSESEEAKIEDEVIPDWLQDISDEVPAIAGESEIEAETQADPAIEDIPEWLQDIAEEQIPEAKEEPESEKLEAPDFEDADAAMAWMESLAAKQGVSEDELLTSPEERSETPPDWVQDIASAEAAAISEIETIAEDETLEEDEIEEIPEWLSEPAQVDETREPEVEEKQPSTEMRDEQPPVLDFPEFLQEPITTETEEFKIEVPDAPESIAETDDAVELEEISADEDIVAPDFEDADAAMAWLESLAAKQGVSEDELLTSPKERSETPPDWVHDVVQSDDTQAEDEELATLDDIPSVEGDIPDWILEAPETKEPADLPETVSDAIEAEEPLIVQEETPPAEVKIPDLILDAPETEELAAKPEMITEATDEVPEIVEVSTSDIDVALTGDEGAVPDFEDADAAMAWLESLAAKQGVSEDELLTLPDERSDMPPDWVQDAIETEEITSVDDLLVEEEPSIEAEDLSDWLAKVPDPAESGELLTDTEGLEAVSEIRESEDEASEAEFDFEDSDAAMAWLESLAAKQGVSEEELLTPPDERRETPPDWVQGAIESAEPAAVTAPQVETIPEVTETLEIPVGEGESKDELPSPTIREEASIAPPSWISDGDVPEDEDISWLQSAVSEEEDQLLDLNQASLIQLERLPGVGFRRAQSITAYRTEHGAFSSFDDLRYVPGMDSDTLSLLKARVYIEAPDFEPEPDFVEETALFETQEADDAVHEQQLAAQSKLNQGDISEAMAAYGELINKGQRLENIIEDLNFAAEKFPEDITIVQTLGDAYMQANQLEEALDAYTKAEGLLQ